MRRPAPILIVWLVAGSLTACTGVEPGTTLAESGATVQAARGGPPPDWVIHEPGYSAEVIATGLDRPQGVVGLGGGVLYATQVFGPEFAETGAEVTRVLPNGITQPFATIPVTPSARMSLVDLLGAPAEGFFSTQIFTRKIYRIAQSGVVEEVAVSPRAPTFLSLDATGRLHINEVVGDVLRLEPTGSLTTVVDANPGPLPAPNRPRGVAFDAAGRLLLLIDEDVVTVGSKLVLRRFDLADATLPLPLSAGAVITDALPLTPGRQPIEDPAIWPAGGQDAVFIIGPDNVYRVSLTDGSFSVFISGLERGTFETVVNALAVTENGDLLVSEFGAGRVTRVRRVR